MSNAISYVHGVRNLNLDRNFFFPVYVLFGRPFTKFWELVQILRTVRAWKRGLMSIFNRQEIF